MNKTHRIGVLGVLVLVVLLGLLLAAGPALAGNPYGGDPPGFQWGLPHFNGTLVFNETFTAAEIVAADPRASGTLRFKITAVDEWVEGNTYYLRHVNDGTLTNAGGVWTYTGAVSLWSGPAEGSRMQGIGYAVTMTGGLNKKTGGTYAGLHLVTAWHTGTGPSAPFILMGWIY